MLKRLKNWDRKLEKVVNDIDRIVSRVAPVNTENKTQTARQIKR